MVRRWRLIGYFPILYNPHLLLLAYMPVQVIMDKGAASGVEFRVFHGRGGSLGRGTN
jgi:hypothetical protein